MPKELFNILLLTDNYPPQRGGMAQSCDRIVRLLRDNNNKVHVVHFCGRASQFKSNIQLNGSHTSIPFEEDEAHTINRLWNYISSITKPLPYTHILAFGGFVSLTAAPILSKWLNLPLAVLFRGNDFDHAIFTSRKIPILERAIEHAQSIGTVTREMQNKIQLLYPNKTIYFTPNSIDSTQWNSLKSDKYFAENFKKKLSLSNKRVIGIFGHLKPKKGIEFFIDCINKSGTATQIHLLLVGEVSENTRSILEDKGINATYLPFLDRFELIKYYLSCDAVVLPSFYDGMPNVLLEACALKIPVIASNVGGMNDVLAKVENNLLFEAGDKVSCISLLIKFLSLTPEKKLNIAKAQYNQINTNFNTKTELQGLLQLFK